MGFIGNLSGFSLHFREKGFLLIGIGMGHLIFSCAWVEE